MFTVRDLAPLSSRWSRPASERAPSPQSPALSLSLSASSLLSHPLHVLFSPSILSVIQTQSPPPLFPLYFHLFLPPTLSITVSYFFPTSTAPLCPSTFPPSPLSPLRLPSFFLLYSVKHCQRGEKAMRRGQITVGGGMLAQPLLLTLGPCARFVCLRRH